ncbi:MAG: single-stranded DNA-binding protein [Clostridia bacterium]|nr:single-stranded DNA-binding protein [Clostridia bacterium]
MTANELLNLAIAETQNIQENEVFLVKDLFKGYEWNRISKSNRLLLGTLFLNYINTSITKITPLDKTSSGQQKYTIKSKY